MKHLTTAALALVLLSACGKDEPEGNELDACLEPAFNLEGCDSGSLDPFATGGIYNFRLDSAGSTFPATGAMRVDAANPANTTFFGLTATDQKLGNGSYFLSSAYVSANVPSRWTFVGCRALNARQIQGFFRRCNVGFEPYQGTFTAERLARREGEAESSGLNLVSETALPDGATGASNVFVFGTDVFVVVDQRGVYRYRNFDPRAPGRPDAYLISARGAELGTPAGQTPADVWSNLQVVGDSLFVTSQNRGLFVFKLSDPAAPPTVLPASANDAVALSALAFDPTKQRLYGLSPEDGSVTVYSTEGAAPTRVSKFLSGSAPTSGDAPLDGVVLGDTLYTSHGLTGVKLINVSNPAALTVISNFAAATLSRTLEVAPIGGSTYAFETGGFWDSRVRVLDVTRPLSISQVGSFATREAVPVSQMATAGTLLYVAYAQDGLRVLDVSNPAQPVQRAYYNTWRASDPGHGVRYIEGATGVAAANGFIYVSDSTRGLLVFQEASAATSPQEGSAR